MALKVDKDVDLLAALERIEIGEIDVAEARALLRSVLEAHADEEGASEVFSSLRSWTGRMLRSTISGEDLRAWHALIKATAAQFRGALRDYSVRINVLADLVYERVGMAETRKADEVLSRRHVRSVLDAIASSEDGCIARADLGRALRLEQANLTRVCTMMLDAGLVARIEEGRTVAFELTAAGATHARATGASSPLPGLGSSVDADVWAGPNFEESDIIDRPAAEPSAEDWSHYAMPEPVWKLAA